MAISDHGAIPYAGLGIRSFRYHPSQKPGADTLNKLVDLNEHGPLAVFRELSNCMQGERLVRQWIYLAMGGCEGCRLWVERSIRISNMHRAYRRRNI